MLFFVAINQTVNALFGVLQVFTKEIPILKRESNANAYSVSAFYVSKAISEVRAVGGAWERAATLWR